MVPAPKTTTFRMIVHNAAFGAWFCLLAGLVQAPLGACRNPAPCSYRSDIRGNEKRRKADLQFNLYILGQMEYAV